MIFLSIFLCGGIHFLLIEKGLGIDENREVCNSGKAKGDSVGAWEVSVLQ